jgi:hypothetical protein
VEIPRMSTMLSICHVVVKSPRFEVQIT